MVKTWDLCDEEGSFRGAVSVCGIAADTRVYPSELANCIEDLLIKEKDGAEL